MAKIECWHFLPDDGCMRYHDRGRVELGATYCLDESPILCERGFHGARRAIDALEYAPGSLCCRVIIGGEIIEDSDKLVGQTRQVLWMADATRTLHEFVCDIAEELLKARRITDKRSWNAIDVKRRWLKQQASDEELVAAKDAAWDAARDAARDAAWAAAGDAARVAARVAARDAAWVAARDAARVAAWAAAGDAARVAAGDAAKAAARVAAKAAARVALNSKLEERLFALLPAAQSLQAEEETP